jgi:hypothetical protein
MSIDPNEATYFIGIALGALAILAVIAVFLRKGNINTGGSILALIGFGLVGLSIWQSLDFNSGGVSFHVSLRTEITNSQSAVIPNLAPSVESPIQYKIG